MQDQQSIGGMTIEDRLSRAEGRKARRHSATAKLTRDEHNRITTAAKAEGKALSEWCRDAMLAAVRADVVTPMFTEVVALRLLLNRALRGDLKTTEAFDAEVQAIRKEKHKAAEQVMQQYTTEQVR